MKTPVEREEIQKEVVLKKCLDCLIENGIEGATIREFSEYTGMTASSLYYWFEDKDEIVLDTTEFGIILIVDKLFDYAIKHVKDIRGMHKGFQEKIKEYSPTLKVVFQVIASPNYGEKINNMTSRFRKLYDTYAEKLANELRKPYATVRSLIDLFISSIIDCVLWSDWEKLSKEMEFLLGLLTTGIKEE